MRGWIVLCLACGCGTASTSTTPEPRAAIPSAPSPDARRAEVRAQDDTSANYNVAQPVPRPPPARVTPQAHPARVSFADCNAGSPGYDRCIIEAIERSDPQCGEPEREMLVMVLRGAGAHGRAATLVAECDGRGRGDFPPHVPEPLPSDPGYVPAG